MSNTPIRVTGLIIFGIITMAAIATNLITTITPTQHNLMNATAGISIIITFILSLSQGE